MTHTAEQNKQLQNNKDQYQTINGCTSPLPCWEIFALGLMFAIEGLNFYLITSIAHLQIVTLYVLQTFCLFFLLLVIIYFFVLSFSDPSDPRLKDPSYTQPNQKIVKCYGCMANVSQTSHHCTTCRRCVDGFDHHCVFLNNCIGAQNYSMFWKFLVLLVIHTAIGMTIGLIIFLNQSGVNKWLSLAFIILQFIVFIEVAILALFHCYLGLCLYKTTLQFLKGDKQAKVAPETQPTAPQSNRQTPKTNQIKVASIHPGSQMDDRIVQSRVVSKDQDSPRKGKEENPHESTQVGFKQGTL